MTEISPPSKDSTQSLVVGPTVQSDRLDRIISLLFPEVSRGEARRLLDAGSVFVNGRRCRIASRIVQRGEEIRLGDLPSSVHTQPLRILFEDDAIVAVEKPAGMPCAPTRSAAAGTALQVVEEQLRERDRRRQPLWLVHRLDAGTSGVLLLAKTKPAAGTLGKMFQARTVTKTYEAWVSGKPPGESGTIDTPLRADRVPVAVSSNGKPALTDWRVLSRQPDHTVLEVTPHTGRMHQIRVHLKSIGLPVLGDRLYGGKRADRLHLYATKLILPTWSNGLPLEISTVRLLAEVE